MGTVVLGKNRALGGMFMYRHNERQTILPGDFFLPFGGKLNPKNRWCRLAKIIPSFLLRRTTLRLLHRAPLSPTVQRRHRQ